MGEILGIDPVFGALLNPTGGLVGPGSDSFEPGDNTAIGYHGIFHDASGYIYNHFDDAGEGYLYLGKEELNLLTSNPVAGQVTGPWHWHNQPHLGLEGGMSPSDGVIILDSTKNMTINGVVQGAIDSTIDWGQQQVDGAIDWVQSQGNQAIDIVQSNETTFIGKTAIELGQGWINVQVDSAQEALSGAIDQEQANVQAGIDAWQKESSDIIHQSGDVIDFSIASARNPLHPIIEIVKWFNN